MKNDEEHRRERAEIYKKAGGAMSPNISEGGGTDELSFAGGNEDLQGSTVPPGENPTVVSPLSYGAMSGTTGGTAGGATDRMDGSGYTGTGGLLGDDASDLESRHETMHPSEEMGS